MDISNFTSEYVPDAKYPMFKIKENGKQPLLVLKEPRRMSIQSKTEYMGDKIIGEQLRVDLTKKEVKLMKKLREYAQDLVDESSDIPSKLKDVEVKKPYIEKDDYTPHMYVNISKYTKKDGSKFGEGKAVLVLRGVLLCPEYKCIKLQFQCQQVKIKPDPVKEYLEQLLEDW